MSVKRLRASSNLAMLEFIARKLGKLKDEFVFLGGCSTALFITDSASSDVRSTIDVDCIVDVISLKQYYRLESELSKQGFKKRPEDNIISRWRYEEVILDVMPTDEKILGFSNRWYKAAIKDVVTHHLANDLAIQSVTAPYFLATKLEAFKSRGREDYLSSHDFEDIITVIDGRPELVDEIRLSTANLGAYLTEIFSTFLKDKAFISALPGHLNYGPITQDRTQLVLERIKKIAKVN